MNLIIVTPVLRRDKYLEALDAHVYTLRAMSFDFKHIIVHACDADDLKGLFANSIFIKEEGTVRGVYNAVGQGFDYALKNEKPTHFSYINSDDLLYVDFLKAVECVRAFPDCLITGEVMWINEQGGSYGKVASWPYNWMSRALFELDMPPFTQQGLIFPVDLWIKTGGFKGGLNFIADSVLWYNALTLGYKRRHVRVPIAGYRLRTGQLSGQRSKALIERDNWRTELPRPNLIYWLCRPLAILIFRFCNLNVYLVRIMAGLKWRADSAMSSGGF